MDVETMKEGSESPSLTAALWYAKKLEWPVLPLNWPKKSGKDAICSCQRGKNCTNIGKHPLWHKDDLPHGAKNATIDELIIRRWWGRWPTANVGIATGHCFDVLDVDVSETEDGRETLTDLESTYGKLPDTVEQITGGGGRQILFMTYSGKLKNAVRFAPGLDIRTFGGLVVVPPSLHASGRRYEWELSSSPSEIPLAPWPKWMLKLVQDASPGNGNGNGVGHPKGWELEFLKGVSKGSRDQTTARLAGLYLQKGLKPIEVYFLLCGWDARNKPPLGANEISKTVKSVAQIHEDNKTGDQDASPHKIKISIG